MTGGQSPFAWSISGGTLPAGLTLATSTGILSGTPTPMRPSTCRSVTWTACTSRSRARESPSSSPTTRWSR
ncbi:MAG: putative Ig domain-containing protein [Chloroflexota bacterium]